jgi:hypothetical protein
MMLSRCLLAMLLDCEYSGMAIGDETMSDVTMKIMMLDTRCSLLTKKLESKINGKKALECRLSISIFGSLKIIAVYTNNLFIVFLLLVLDQYRYLS